MRRLGTSIDDYEIGALETERIGFYARLRWEEWRGSLGGRTDDGEVIWVPDQRGVMVLRLDHTPPIDLGAAMTIECQAERIW